MPLYEYTCKACGEREEKIQAFSAPTEHDCPKCGQAEGMVRQISVSGFTLAGSGWYNQGYAGPAREAKEAPAAEASKPPCAGGCACHSPRVQSLKDKS